MDDLERNLSNELNETRVFNGSGGPGPTTPIWEDTVARVDSIGETVTREEVDSPAGRTTEFDASAAAGNRGPKRCAGIRIGNYMLVDRLGEGSQGTVWKAVQTAMERVVALKVLDISLAIRDAEAERFRKEASRGGRLCAQSILPIYDFGTADGHAFIAMQYVDGCSLHGLIGQRRRRLAGRTPTEVHRLAIESPQNYIRGVLAILVRIARALQVAHDAHIIHRDIKPANILLDRHEADRVYLADFGLARDLDDVTQASVMFEPGTPVYMPPERLNGVGKIDEIRADVYSLGVTLYETITLTRPFQFPKDLPRSEWGGHLSSIDPPRPRSIDAHVERDLEEIMLKAIARKPSDRYRTAGELADDIDRYLRGEPVLARPPGLVRRLCRRLGRRRKLLTVIGMVVVVGLSIATARIEMLRRIHARAEVEIQSAALSLNANQLGEAVRHFNAARLLDPAHPEIQRFTPLLCDALALDLGDSGDRENLDDARNVFNLLSEVVGPTGNITETLRRNLGIRLLPVTSNRAHTTVEIRTLLASGEPNPFGLIAAVHFDEINQRRVLRDVFSGRYWVTAYDPASQRTIERVFVTIDHNPRDFYPLVIEFPDNAADPDMVAVAGTTFNMGRSTTFVDLHGNTLPRADREFPEHLVKLAPYLIDKHEVTNREFARFLDATQSLPPQWKSAYRKFIWGEAAAPDPARLDWPVVKVTYDAACDYAAWRGARLPLEEELEFLGRGHSKIERPAGWDLAKLAERPLHAVGTDPLDHAPPPYESIVDVYGNAGELTLLRYRWYNAVRLQPRQDDATGIAYVVRAGWVSDLQDQKFVNLGSIQRGLILPAVYAPTIGFRCARSVTPRFPIEEVPHAN